MRKGTAIGLALAILAALGLWIWLLDDETASTGSQPQAAHARPTPAADCIEELDHERARDTVELPDRSRVCGLLETVTTIVLDAVERVEELASSEAQPMLR